MILDLHRQGLSVSAIARKLDLDRKTGQPRPADPKPGRLELLMMSVLRQVPGELVDQQPGGKAHIGAAPFEDPRRRRHGMNLGAGL